MSTPYHFSPRVPPGPHPTPLSSSSYSVSHTKHTRPPIYNPYDKFTQPEFDAWIGGITGALRKALGQVDDEPTYEQVPPEQHGQGVGSRGSSIEEEGDDLAPEDSFAEIKARRAMGKGKARDPREGPGLQGVGDKEQPIEILSDEEEEEEARSGSEEGQGEDEEEWDEDVRSGDEEEEDEKLSWHRGQRPSGTGPPGMRERPVDDGYDEEEDYEEDSGEEAQPHRGSSEVIELSDSDDIVQPRQTRPQQQHPQIQHQQRQFSAEEEDYEEEYSGEESYEEDEEPSLTSHLIAQRRQPQHQNEGLSPELVEDDDDEIQPEDDDTSFPPHSSLHSTDTAVVDIPDPWKGPQTYAEDFYSGGDAALRAPRDAHRLGPSDLDYEGFLTPGVGTPAELEDEEEGDEVWDEDEGEVEEEQKQKLEQPRSWEGEPEIIAVDSDEEEEEEDILEQPQRQRYEAVLDEEEVEEEEEDQLPRSSPPASSPIDPPTMLHQPTLRPEEEEVLDFDALYDDMETEVVEDNQREQAEIISNLVDWNYPPAFPTGVPTSAPGHLATPSSEEEDATMGNATFMSVHMESSITSPFGRQESAFVHFESTPLGPTAAPPIDLDVDEEYDEEEEEIEMDPRDMPLGTSDLDVRDLDEEGGQQGEEDIVEVVKPGEVVEAEAEEQDENKENKEAERAMSAVEEVVMEEETYEAEVSEPDAPCAGADKQDTSPEITIVEDTEEVRATTKPALPAAAPSLAAAAMEADTSGETASIEELGEVKELATPEAEPGVMEIPKPSENVQDVEEIQPVEDIEEVEEVQSAEVVPTLEYADSLEGVLDMGVVASGDEDEFVGMDDLQYPEEVQPEMEEVQPAVEEVRPMDEAQPIEAEVQPVEEEVQSMEEEILAGSSTAANQPVPSQQELATSAPQPTPAAAPFSHYPIYDFEQLPTPPSERMHTTELPPTTEFDDAFPCQIRHPVEMEEIQDEDATPPGSPALAKFTIPEDMDLELETSMGRKIEKKLQADPRGYLVDEAQSPEEKREQLSGQDADWGVDWEVEVASVSSSGIVHAEVEEEEEREAGYTVEEPLTETDGRTTEEPSTRATSLRIASVDAEGQEPVSMLDQKPEEEVDVGMDGVAIPAAEAETFHALTIDTSAPPPTSPEGASNITFEVIGSTPQEQKFPEEQEPPTIESQAEEPSAPPAQASSSSAPLADDALVPVSAGANVSDVTESPARQAQPLVLNLPGTPTFMLSPAGTPGTGPTPVSIPVPQSILKALKQQGNYRSRAEAGPSGLFTPGERSGAATPNILLEMPQGGVDTNQEAEGSGTTQDEESILEAGADQHATDAGQEMLPTDERLTILEHLAGVSGSATVVGAEDDGLKSTEPAVDVFGSVESTEASQLAAAAFALARQAQTPSHLSSLAYRAPSSFDHPMRVPMSRRKSTDPILVSDPYPASLSTPVSSFPYTKEEESSEGTEQENSMSSSSTIENRQDEEDEETVTDNILDIDGIGDFGYQVEPHVLQPFAESPAGPSTTQISSTVVGDSGEVDADGDLDLELLTSPVSPVKQPPQVPKLTTDAMKEEDPFKLMGTDSTVAPGAVQEDVSPVEAKSKSPESTPGLVVAEKPNPSPLLQVQEAKVSTDTPKSESISETQPTTIGTEAPSLSSHELSGDKPLADGPSAEAVNITTNSTPLPSKRKRTRSPTASRLPRIVSTKKATKRKEPSAAKESKVKTKSNGKGHGDTIAVKRQTKEKEKAKTAPARERSVDSSSSGASAAARLLLRPSSRASSVASTTPSDKSLVIQPSPTVNKPPTTGVPLPPPPPPPLFHAHGSSRNKAQAQPPPLTVQQQLHRQMPRVPSFTRNDEQQLPSPSSAHPPHLPLTPRTSSTAGSPITRSTRSQCRYHKISLPKEEGGPRVCFLVPGCSLTDKKLMDEEEIEDHGDATHEDSYRMIKDIGSLDFDAYLIGILRQLVGVDILREQEVFYLPSPGEEVPRRLQHRRTASEKASWARVPEGTTMGSPSLSTASFRSPTSSKAPASIAGSTGTSGSILRRARGSDKGTHSNYSETENESSEDNDNDDELPKAKRSRPSPPDENVDTVAMGPPVSQPQSTKRSKSRRGKRLTADYLPYKPESDHETSVDEDESRSRRKRPAKRGIKRARTTGSVVAEDVDGRKSKKLKSHASDVTERTAV